MDVYIKTKDETFHFPVNPFSISVNGGKKYDTFDILYKGEKDFPSNAKRIRELTIATMFPAEYEPYCQYRDIPTPQEAMNKIITWSESDAIVRLIITDYGFNELVLIADYTEDETGESQGDKYVTLNFRVVAGDGTTNLITIEKPQTQSPAPKLKDNRPKQQQEKVYVVKPGDSLYKIAKQVYGNGAKYNMIYEANRNVIGNNPNLIYPGQKFIIPG